MCGDVRLCERNNGYLEGRILEADVAVSVSNSASEVRPTLLAVGRDRTQELIIAFAPGITSGSWIVRGSAHLAIRVRRPI
jgi:hypothetical protein